MRRGQEAGLHERPSSEDHRVATKLGDLTRSPRQNPGDFTVASTVPGSHRTSQAAWHPGNPGHLHFTGVPALDLKGKGLDLVSKGRVNIYSTNELVKGFG